MTVGTDDDMLDHISICICTLKRPMYLARLLSSLSQQQRADLFEVSITVIDNDESGSAQRIVADCTSHFPEMTIRYFREPERNIAVARNRAVERSIGKFVAFIDDDEFPQQGWLELLYLNLKRYNAHGVLGPVCPHFDSTPPRWISASKICERRRFTTGTILNRPSLTRTGNVLFDRCVFEGEMAPFDPEFGLTGGEDVEFFRGKIASGFRFVWCDEAVVFESVPPERMTRAYHLRRALLRGLVNSHKESAAAFGTVKSIAAVFVYACIIPPLIIFNSGRAFRYLVSCCDHLGKILGFLGIDLVKNRA